MTMHMLHFFRSIIVLANTKNSINIINITEKLALGAAWRSYLMWLEQTYAKHWQAYNDLSFFTESYSHNHMQQSQHPK